MIAVATTRHGRHSACNARVMRMRIACTLVATTAVFFTAFHADAQPRKGRKPAPAAPLDPEAADDAKLRSGIDLVEAREPKKAIPELERLYATTKKPRALYWLARAYQDAGKNADALRTFKRFLKEGGSSVPQSRNVEVLGHVQTLTMQVAMVTIAAPAGAMITVDDVELGEAPLAEPVALDPGKHTIAAKGAGEKTIEVAEESRTTVDLERHADPEPPPAPAPVAAAAPAPAPARASSSNTGVVIGGLGLATLLAGGSVFFTVKALGTSSDFDAKKHELGATQDDLDGLQSKARLQSGLAVGLGVAALATAGVTLFVLRKPSGPETQVVTTGNGFAIRGGF